MTTRSICFAGLSRDEQATVEAAFKQANAAHRWALANENEAEAVVVDMDSMYGQMSLMKAMSGGKVVVALTAGGRVDADYQLARPVTAEGVSALLSQIEAQAPATPAPAPAVEDLAPAAPDQGLPAGLDAMLAEILQQPVATVAELAQQVRPAPELRVAGQSYRLPRVLARHHAPKWRHIGAMVRGGPRPSARRGVQPGTA